MLSGSSGVVVCTENAKIQLTTTNGGLVGPSSATAPFIKRIDYSASATYNGVTEALNTSGRAAGFQTTGTSSTAGAQSGASLVVSVTSNATPAGNYLVPGSYVDTLVITLTPVP